MTKSLKIKFCLVAVPLCSFFLATSIVFAGSVKKFALTDGSTLHAEILSYAKGVYQLRSGTLGKFSLSEDKIQSIEFSNARHSSGGGEPSKSSSGNMFDQKQIDQMKNKILADPQANKLIDEIQKDPNLQQILNDKDLVQAIERGDVGRLLNDSKIQSLMNNKEIGKLIEKAK